MESQQVIVQFHIMALHPLFEDVDGYLSYSNDRALYVLGLLTEMGLDWRFYQLGQGIVDIYFPSEADYIQFKLTWL